MLFRKEEKCESVINLDRLRQRLAAGIDNVETVILDAFAEINYNLINEINKLKKQIKNQDYGNLGF
ncbi:MAG: hypothetical protein LBP26_02435 [Clostridiales bacterium]|jgi:hypothetical protein|nr:hypothetical protein [Clostridiales bacterium]